MAELTVVLDRALRDERLRIVASLLRVCRTIDEAEDALHDATLAALRGWGDHPPRNPGAWLLAVARRRARDRRRHQSVVDAHAHSLTSEPDDNLEARDPDEIADDELRLLCACCHPSLAADSRIALTLSVVVGLGTAEIARAFVASEETISQRILRAKRALDPHIGELSSASRAELDARLPSVLGVVYAMYTEGHSAQRGALMRLELQRESLRLLRLLSDLAPRDAHAFALLALVCFGLARAPSREDADGAAIAIDRQDRSLWDRALLREGLIALQFARSIDTGSSYVLQAQIAAEHCVAASFRDTDWSTIVALYDALARVDGSQVVLLHRAIAVSMRDGPRAGLAELVALEAGLVSYAPFYAARAHMRQRLGLEGADAAAADLVRAIALASNDGERLALQRRLDALVATTVHPATDAGVE